MNAWPSVKLSEVAKIERRTVAPSAISSGTIYVGLENIAGDGTFYDVRPVDDGELSSAKFLFDKRHVLYGKLRPYLAKIACADFSGVCSTDILPILPNPELDRNYLCQFLRQPEMVQLASSKATGMNLPRISQNLIHDFDIPLPSLSEQQRIVAIIGQAETVRMKRRQSIGELDQLAQSAYIDMFGELKANREAWPSVYVGEFVERFETGKNVIADGAGVPGEYRVLKVSSVTSLIYDSNECKLAPSDYLPPEKHIVHAGDLLFSRANTRELVGATAYVRQTPPKILLPDKLWRFVWRRPLRVHPLYIRALFRQRAVRSLISSLATGSSGSMKNISQEKVLSIPVRLPPLELQHEFACRVEAIEEVRDRYQVHLVELDALFESLRHRAFRGEL